MNDKQRSSNSKHNNLYYNNQGEDMKLPPKDFINTLTVAINHEHIKDQYPLVDFKWVSAKVKKIIKNGKRSVRYIDDIYIYNALHKYGYVN